MKNLKLIFLLAFLSLFMSGANPLPVTGNYFNIETGYISCSGDFACWHEEAHALDKKLGWISRTGDWKYAIEVYRRVSWECVICRDKMSKDVEFFPGIGAPYLTVSNPMDLGFWQGGWGGHTELYAMIYAWAAGKVSDIPSGLKGFYVVVP